MNIDVIKIASCSAADWPLIKKIGEAGKPVIFSTGGLDLNQIDDLVSYFDHCSVPQKLDRWLSETLRQLAA